MTTKVNIQGIPKDVLIRALWENAHANLFYGGARPYDEEVVSERISHQELYFDYLFNKVMKVDLSGDEVNPKLYDRDAGDGTFARTVQELREELQYLYNA